MPETFVPSSAGKPGNVALRNLRLDPENPRIPEAHRSDSTAELAVLVEMGFEAFSVAESIAELGFFNAEPLIVVPNDAESGTWIVAEGNRRLTALIGLAFPDIRASFATPERWEGLAQKREISPEMAIPVIMHESRDTVHHEVARVHVVGKLPWQPFMTARYIAARVAEGRSLAEVADMIGIPRSRAADMYRDQAVLLQAQSLGLETSQVESAFSLLTNAMRSTKLRSHVGAPLGSQTQVGVDPIPASKARELEELIQWIFGDEEHEAVISDSREISKLANVVASEVGLAALRQGRTLEEARQSVADAGLDPRTSLLRKLVAGKNSLTRATDEVLDFALDGEVRSLIEDIESIAMTMRSIIDDASFEEA